MFITKKALSRRTVLRGMGATLALPLLDAMVPALTAMAQTAANPVRRFGAVFVPLGERPGLLDAGDSRRELRVLADPEAARAVPESHDGRLAAVRPARRPRHHGGGVADRRDSQAHDGRGRPRRHHDRSGDRRADRQDTPLPSLELATEDFTGYIGGCDPSYSCAYMNTISWKNATTPLPMEINPRVVFERMFGRPGTSAQRLARMADRPQHPRLGAPRSVQRPAARASARATATA